MLNVKNSPYRAVGNGIADDTSAIQSAINAASGDTVFLPAGRYNISRPLNWTAPDIALLGDGGTKINPIASFQGEAAILIGKTSTALSPTHRAGLRNISVDLSDCAMPNLIAVELVQCWFAHIDALKIFSPNGLSMPRQTAFQIHGGALASAPPLTNWAVNNNVFDLQVAGSFAYSVRHVGGGPGGTVNGTNYFGGSCYGNAANKAGTFGFRIDPLAGDTTRVFGMALEDFDTGVYVGSQNNGPLDFRIEDCTTPYAVAPGITFSIPGLVIKP